jgi:OOP family OmpA-OmpF porin
VLGVLSRLAGGHVEISDKTVAVDGLTFVPGAVEQIVDSLASDLPPGFTVATDNVSARQADQPVTPAQCRDLIQGVLQTGAIRFEGNNADISSNSFGVLDRVAAAIGRCPDAAVEVSAHSDNQGSASRNRDRTQARAEAIVEYLVSAGIKRERLKAVGLGEDNPIGDNNTEAGRAANQRIEFSVALPDGG